MFTGIVEELGTVTSTQPLDVDGAVTRVRVDASTVLTDVEIGASIAVNGCCLSVVAYDDGWCEFDVSAETLARTNIGALGDGDRVNLERPVAVGDRLGGHIVLGHVDGVGEIVATPPTLTVRIPLDLAAYVVEKGSIAIDGISLTAFNLRDDLLDVAIIPHTAAHTTLGHRAIGDAVNIEVDVLAKHVERLIEPRQSA